MSGEQYPPGPTLPVPYPIPAMNSWFGNSRPQSFNDLPCDTPISKSRTGFRMYGAKVGPYITW